jgi:hypothetical protein
MAGDVHHIVDAAEEPEVPVLVDPRAVAGEVHARIPRPVRLEVPLRVVVDPAQHRRPGPPQNEIPAAPGTDLVPLLVVDRGIDPGERLRRRPRLRRRRYQRQASGLIGSPTDPSSRSFERSCRAAYSGPHFMCARIAVGAV